MPQPPVPQPVVKPWLWPNLLSLDAPLVAAVWQLLFARCFHTALDPVAATLLVLAVWLIYAGDRILDAWTASSTLPRHEFYRRHWRAVVPVWLAIFALSAWLACTQLTGPTFERGIVLAAAVALYFSIVHLLRPAWPKELAVAILFAMGATLSAWNAIRSAADIETIVLFSCLCWINCIAIERWETGEDLTGRPLETAAILVAGAAAITYSQRPVLSSAEMASAIAFVILEHTRRRLSGDALRVLADAALLTPLLFLPLSGIL